MSGYSGSSRRACSNSARDTPEKGLSRDVDDLTSTHNRCSPRVGSPERPREMLRAFHDICNYLSAARSRRKAKVRAREVVPLAPLVDPVDTCIVSSDTPWQPTVRQELLVYCIRKVKNARRASTQTSQTAAAKNAHISHVCCEHGHRAEAAKGCAHLWQGEGPAALGAVLVVSKLIGEDLDSAHVQKSACRERREGRGQRPARKRCNRLGARHASGVRGQWPHPSGSAAAAIWRPKRIPPGVSSAKVTMTALALAAAIGLPPTLARETEVPSANAANALWAPTASIIDRASATTPIAMPSKDA